MYDEKKLLKFGQALGARLQGGEVIELIGDVGAGKTTLTKAIARGMGIDEPMQSPTFTIVNRYENDKGVTLAHYDFYRLHDAGVMHEEIREALEDERTVVVVEWSGVVSEVLPEDRLAITLEPVSETERSVTVHPMGLYSRRLVEEL